MSASLPKEVGHGGQAETLILLLGEDAEAGEGAEDAIEGAGMGANCLRQFLLLFAPSYRRSAIPSLAAT